MPNANVSPNRAGVAGAISAGLALGLTELVAGLTERVPSAVAAAGGLVIDWPPRGMKELAISIFGTADKGALAIGTVIIGVLVGWFVGRASTKRAWLPWAAFGAFAVVGIAASLTEIQISPPLTILTIAAAAGIGVATLRA